MKILVVLALLGAVHGRFHFTPATETFLQRVSPGFFSVTTPASLFSPVNQAERLPVAGFGLRDGSTPIAGTPISFSNPPPPLGSDTDPAAQSCGLTPPACLRSRYRTIDGSCNNLQRPVWGMPNTPYGRLTAYNYADGIYAWPVSSSGNPLPNPRTVSLQLFPDKSLVDPVWNLNAQQWGQIVTHDMSLTAGVAQSHVDRIQCCNNAGQLVLDSATNRQCAPILIPPQDPVHGPVGTQCMNFVRTTTTLDRACTGPDVPAEPLSVVTSYMDLSLVYGNSPGQANPIRAFVGGRLLTILRGGAEWPPQDPNVTMTCESAQSPNEPCYLTGDIRVNQNPQLALLQIILLREHNRIADAFAKLNPHWSDEIIFQEARRLNIAQVQHINYYEYLPIFLGVENMIKNKLIYPGVHGYVNDYNPAVNPSILDEHATAAFRHFHTLIRGYLQLASENRELLGAIRLSDWFNRPLVLELDDSFTRFSRGFTAQNMEFSDQFWDSEITQFLFKRNNTFGGDLRAIDVQRGRDHGLGPYAAARAVCGLPVPQTFHDMADYIDAENIQVLQSLYENPQDVDLVVAGSLERLVPGAQAGPTFLCILTEQFYRTRTSDRFFFENGADPLIAFTPHQLHAIRQGASMARLLCDNTPGLSHMQPKAFQLINPQNQLLPCESLPAINLHLWREHKGHFK